MVETKSSHLRKITTVRWDLNEGYHFKTHDIFFTFRCKWGITNHWSRQNHHIQKKKTAHQTSMKSIISNFTMYFSYSDENGGHKSLVETKSSHLRKITSVRWDLNEGYHFKTHDIFFTFRCKWGITNHWSRQNHHIQKKTTAHQTSMKSIISNFTMNFSYSDENGGHKSLVETKSSHLRKITSVRWDLNEGYHFKTHNKFFTFR